MAHSTPVILSPNEQHLISHAAFMLRELICTCDLLTDTEQHLAVMAALDDVRVRETTAQILGERILAATEHYRQWFARCK